MLLLSGPPGYGKTTLAHIAAKQAGYHPMEINASDDRSGSAIVQRVLDAMEMKSVFGNNRPNLIILDEIDGAAASGGDRGLQQLVKLIVATAKARRDGGSNRRTADAGGSADAGAGSGATFTLSKKSGKKKAKKQKLLTRPLICICNNKVCYCGPCCVCDLIALPCASLRCTVRTCLARAAASCPSR